MTSHDALAEFSAVLWPALVDHLWQATLVSGLCLLALPAFRRAGGQARHSLWALAFVRFAIPPALVLFAADRWGLPLVLKGGIGSKLQQTSGAISQVTQPSILVGKLPANFGSMTVGHPELFCVLTTIWIAGSIFLLARWCFRQHRFGRALRAAAHEVETELIPTLELLKCKLKIRLSKKLRIVWQGSEPGVCGVWRPILVFPEGISRKLDPAELEGVVAHELVHVARRDNLWSNLQMLVCCVFWFCPIIWFLDQRLIAERERSCDERVITALNNSQAYASGVIKIASMSLGLQIARVSFMADTNLKRRIEDMSRTKKAGLAARILLCLVAALTLIGYIVALPLQKNLAQSTPLKITIENSGNSPLQIVSATAAEILVPKGRTRNVTGYLIKPGIVLKYNSGRTVSMYVLEFGKADSESIYLTRTNLELAPNKTDSITTNAPNTFLYSAKGKPAGAPATWTIRLDMVRFKDGSVLTLHGSPIPPPDGSGAQLPLPGSAKPVPVRPVEPSPKW